MIPASRRHESGEAERQDKHKTPSPVLFLALPVKNHLTAWRASGSMRGVSIRGCVFKKGRVVHRTLAHAALPFLFVLSLSALLSLPASLLLSPHS